MNQQAMNPLSAFAHSTRELKSLRNLTFAAVLSALYAITYMPYIGNIIIVKGVVEIRFGFLIIAMAAMLYGPVVGSIVAMIGDLLGSILFYGGEFIIGYTFTWMLQGVVFGLFFYKCIVSIPRVIGAVTVNTVVVNLLITTTLQMLTMKDVTFQALLVQRLPLNLGMFPVRCILLYAVLRLTRELYRRLSRART